MNPEMSWGNGAINHIMSDSKLQCNLEQKDHFGTPFLFFLKKDLQKYLKNDFFTKVKKYQNAYFVLFENFIIDRNRFFRQYKSKH